ncbi:maleylpyruvate isomerase N-terminal domain-containing protein [Nocardioides litoris]|uniref:maleylpyruvate isomerase N-terminal domain-containing protein n=1 Tax=Nocardioides litoris TaxID=1926648 RepID=UPI00147710E1|nr:maleylpyruvate isomerase N-terminal domain-containing protein [Nocardioides litoris]
MTDWGALYADHVARLATLADGLAPDDGGRPVPGTPAWTVHDVLAHLAGVGADNLTGRTDGAPGPEWTAFQVAERAALPLAAVVEELVTNAADVAAVVDAGSTGITYDVSTHHADLLEALGRPRLAEPLWRPVLDDVAPRRASGLVDRVPAYELWRGIFSRRSQAQLRALGLSAEQAADLGFFGPRTDDQPVPGT